MHREERIKMDKPLTMLMQIVSIRRCILFAERSIYAEITGNQKR